MPAGTQVTVFEGLTHKPPPAPVPGGLSRRMLQDLEHLKRSGLYEDGDVIMLNKPQGLATQGGQEYFPTWIAC